MVRRNVVNKLGIQAEKPRCHGLLERRPAALKPCSQIQDGRKRGGADTIKKMKKSRSFKASDFETSEATPSRCQRELSQVGKLYDVSQKKASPSYMKPTSSSDARRESLHLQVSPGAGTSVKNKNSTSPGARAPSSASGLKQAKVLKRNSSLKPVRPVMKKSCGVVGYAGQATCSSTLKDSKFPPYVELHPEGTSIMKVCPYNYCSLNGHHHRHPPSPLLKRFLSIRRRLLKAQKSLKLEGLPSARAENSEDGHRGIDTGQADFDEYPVILNLDSDSPAIPSLMENVYEDFFVEIFAKSRPDSTCDGHSSQDGGNHEQELFSEDKNNLGKNMDDDSMTFPQDSVQIASDCSDQSNESMKGMNEDVIVFDAVDMDWKEKEGFNSDNATDYSAFFSKESVSISDYLWEKEDSSDVASNSNDYIGICEEEAPENTVTPTVLEENSGGILDGIGGGSYESETKSGVCVERSISLESVPEKDHSADTEHEKPGYQLQNIVLQKIEDNEHDDHETTAPVAIENTENIGMVPKHANSEDDPMLNLNEAQVGAAGFGIPQKDDTFDAGANSYNLLPETSNNQKMKFGKGSKRHAEDEDELRKFNPWAPWFLDPEAEIEAEKVDLRHQEMEERKNAEEWMVDHALQQAVTKLASARKRRVALLVEAFETVALLPKCDAQLRHSAPCFTPRPILSCS